MKKKKNGWSLQNRQKHSKTKHTKAPGGLLGKTKLGVLMEHFEKGPKEVPRSYFVAWLEIIVTPKTYQFSNNTYETKLPFYSSVLKRYCESSQCGPF